MWVIEGGKIEAENKIQEKRGMRMNMRRERNVKNDKKQTDLRRKEYSFCLSLNIMKCLQSP